MTGYIYGFGEIGNATMTKIGFTSDDPVARFRDQQPCNPVTLALYGAFAFDDEREAKRIENDLKAGRGPFPHAPGTSVNQEWYVASEPDFLACPIFTATGGRRVSNLPRTLERYRDDLNPGDVRGRWSLRLYLLREETEAGYCKVHATAYNWHDTGSVYLTGNPRRTIVADRWRATTNAALLRARDETFSRFSKERLPYGWLRSDWRQVQDAIRTIILPAHDLVLEPFNPVLDARSNSRRTEYRVPVTAPALAGV